MLGVVRPTVANDYSGISPTQLLLRLLTALGPSREDTLTQVYCWVTL